MPGFYEGFPWSNGHQLNLDWLLNEMKKLLLQYTDFVAVNTVTYGGVWEITKNYAAWTIVSEGNNAYISKQPVPVGVPLDNRDYWVEAAELDPRIAALIQQVADIETAIDGLKTAIDGLETAVDGLETEVELLRKRKYLFIGDSYMAQSTKIQESIANGADFETFAMNGYGFGPTYSNPDTTFAKILEEKSADPSFTDVIVIGGINDVKTGVNTTSYYQSHVVSLYDTIHTLYQNAKVYTFVCVGPPTEPEQATIKVERTLTLLLDNIGEPHSSKAYYYMCAQPYTCEDGLHYTDDGYARLGHVCRAALNNAFSMGDIETVEGEGYKLVFTPLENGVTHIYGQFTGGTYPEFIEMPDWVSKIPRRFFTLHKDDGTTKSIIVYNKNIHGSAIPKTGTYYLNELVPRAFAY